MIPPFEPTTGNLPEGEHAASWQEMVQRYGYTPWRQQLLNGLLRTLYLLRSAGCQRAWIDGSFVTAKTVPGDFDACWDTAGVDFDLVDDRLLTFDLGRATQKAAFLGEFFIADSKADPQGTLFRDFFQQDRNGHVKGIIILELKDLP
jgi:hypothetical protein